MDTVKLLKLKQTAEELSRRKEQATGRMQELMAQLRREFNCDSLEEARLLLRTLQRQQKKLSEHYTQKLKMLEETYGHFLGD